MRSPSCPWPRRGYRFVIETPAGNALGWCDLYAVEEDQAELGYWIDARYWNRGYATEAARAVMDLLLRLGVREIRASINPIHTSSIRVAERLGLRRTDEFTDGELIWKQVYSSADAPKHETG